MNTILSVLLSAIVLCGGQTFAQTTDLPPQESIDASPAPQAETDSQLNVFLDALKEDAKENGYAFDLKPEIGIVDVVFLRNLMEFTDERQSGGASSSFIDINGDIYVLTAKHLLTDAMGVVPTVLPSKFEEEFLYWVVTDNVTMNTGSQYYMANSITGIFRPDDNMSYDLMVLSANVPYEQYQTNVLPISKSDVKSSDQVFVIGCPYSLDEKCLQKIYSGKVTSVTSTEVSFSWDTAPDSLSGFSGAAVLNDRGEIVAVVWGGSQLSGRATLLPDWLKKLGQ